MPPDLEANDIAWLDAYVSEVRRVFGAVFDANGERFKQGSQLFARFEKTVGDVLEGGRGNFNAVDEAHNELCIADALLACADPRFTKLEYEPPLPNCKKSIDFRAESEGGKAVFIDVKTIKPLSKDRWDQYERAVKEGWFPKNVALILDKEWLGGELWHHAFAARGRMLEYTIELEQKIAQAGLAESNSLFVVVFCGEGFYWRQDELEDFVSFYRSGVHRSDDSFSLAEEKYMTERGLTVSKSISRFACARRHQGDVHFKRLNWNVQAPIDPAFC